MLSGDKNRGTTAMGPGSLAIAASRESRPGAFWMGWVASILVMMIVSIPVIMNTVALQKGWKFGGSEARSLQKRS